MKKHLLAVMILAVIPVMAADKSALDLSPYPLGKAAGNGGAGGQLQTVENSILSISMIRGGCYTIGTVDGISSSTLDDHCGVTFGHPFAMTSYPLLSVDGEWASPLDYYDEESALIPRNDGRGGLVVQAGRNGLLSFSFSMRPEGASVLATIRIANTDANAHSAALGLVFDPALGKWGDGYLSKGSGFLEQDTTFTGSGVPSSVSLWERQQGARGIGVALAPQDRKPSQIDAANWTDVYAGPNPGFDDGGVGRLYDLCLKMHWSEKRLAPGESDSVRIRFTLLDPDFSSEAFMRWDLPAAFTMTDNVVFPRDLATHLQINFPIRPAVGSGQFIVETGPGIKALNSDIAFDFTGGAQMTEKLALRSSEIFEDRVSEAGVALMRNGIVLDAIGRNVFVPAPPVSDTGLDVVMDSLIASGFPRVQFIFHADVSATHFPIRELYPENIFLFEDGSRVPKFTIADDTTGGIQNLDLVFVLDVTGSMGGTIEAVKNNIIEFADSLRLKRVDYRMAMVTFLDAVENVYPFTTDVSQFKQWVSEQSAHAGGDGPENSLDALVRAGDLPMRPDAKRVFIWITDINYHEADWATTRTKQEVIPILVSKGITVHAVGAESEKATYYDPILLATGGNYYNIYGNFRDILMDIGRIKTGFRFMLSYVSSQSAALPHQIRLELHTTGLGGYAETGYTAPGTAKAAIRLDCYPNPFNPDVSIHIRKSETGRAEIRIFDVMGRDVRRISLGTGGRQNVLWNARDDRGMPVAAGFYIVQLLNREPDGTVTRAASKILYLK